jgi:hypothetical protein
MSYPHTMSAMTTQQINRTGVNVHQSQCEAVHTAGDSSLCSRTYMPFG